MVVKVAVVVVVVVAVVVIVIIVVINCFICMTATFYSIAKHAYDNQNIKQTALIII